MEWALVCRLFATGTPVLKTRLSTSEIDLLPPLAKAVKPTSLNVSIVPCPYCGMNSGEVRRGRDGDLECCCSECGAVPVDADELVEGGAEEIGAMWRMLCEATQTQGREHWRLDFQIGADGCSAHWEAHYLFSATGRLVHNRIDATFTRLRAAGRTALIPYVTTGDPSLEATLDVMRALVMGGADVIELGVPFSDPMADGPVIQRASERALANGTLIVVASSAARTGNVIALNAMAFENFFIVFVPTCIEPVAHIASALV